MKFLTLLAGLFFFVFNCSAQTVLAQKGLVIEQDQQSAQIKLTLNTANTIYQIKQENNHLVIKAPLLSESLSETIKQNNTIIDSINLEKDNGILTLNAKAPIKYYAAQVDNHLTITVFSADTWQEKPHLSMRVVNIPVRLLLLTLADLRSINILIDDTVTENISLDFREVPKDQIIPLILQAKKLENIDGEGMRIILPKNLASRIKVTPYSPLIHSKSDTERMSINFSSITTKSLLGILSDFSVSKFNLPDTELGSMTIRAKDVPWLQILTNVAAVKGLTFKR